MKAINDASSEGCEEANFQVKNELDSLLCYYLRGAIPGTLKSKAKKLAKYWEVKNEPVPKLKPWTDKDKIKYQELKDKHITLQSTELGQAKQQRKKEMLDSVQEMTQDERLELMDCLKHFLQDSD